MAELLEISLKARAARNHVASSEPDTTASTFSISIST